ncbi:MAG: mechanosensitive ion channel family protein [Rudaea sp.]|uniref:mechanosensitive ion channel family protein n=1 Tax=Rudaea sp. TaxID=2136325 RepID=UPI0039E21452
MSLDPAQLQSLVSTYVVPLVWKIIGAIVLWVVGRWVIALIGAGVGRVLDRRKLDPTLTRYTVSVASGLLTVLLGIAVLSVLGVETASFAALLAAAGVAIGMAWSGLLANFAAGVFLITLRPFKVGDMITAGGITGTVREIGLFGTTLDMGDNVKAVLGNNKIFADTIVNYSANAYRRVDLTALLASGVDVDDAKSRLRAAVAQVNNVLANPAPDIEILEHAPLGTVLTVRPYCHNDNYWQVYFDTNKAIGDTAKSAGWPAPEARQAVRQL